MLSPILLMIGSGGFSSISNKKRQPSRAALRPLAENLRNHAVSGAVLKVGGIILLGEKTTLDEVPAWAIIIVVSLAFWASLMQSVAFWMYATGYWLNRSNQYRKTVRVVVQLLIITVLVLLIAGHVRLGSWHCPDARSKMKDDGTRCRELPLAEDKQCP